MTQEPLLARPAGPAIGGGAAGPAIGGGAAGPAIGGGAAGPAIGAGAAGPAIGGGASGPAFTFCSRHTCFKGRFSFSKRNDMKIAKAIIAISATTKVRSRFWLVDFACDMK